MILFWVTASLHFLLDVGVSINHDNIDCQQLANFQESKAMASL
jgi:hypothetical protein